MEPQAPTRLEMSKGCLALQSSISTFGPATGHLQGATYVLLTSGDRVVHVFGAAFHYLAASSAIYSRQLSLSRHPTQPYLLSLLIIYFPYRNSQLEEICPMPH